ncbi:MAG TPA: amidohydrolase, partial [Cyclobacteriaceae bacterium]
MKKSLQWILIPLFSFPFYGQTQDKKWDVSNTGEPLKEIEIETSEGTWMNLDVSPDGREIVFDLLGDIYIMPVGGGNATILREGPAYEVQPRFSPNGKQISFTSDAGGGDNIWIMEKNGAEAKQVTKEDFRLMNNAVWTQDGKYLIARKHFTSQRSLGAGELWMYHITGGSGIQLTKRKNDQQDLGEPSVSPDGRYVYYSEDVYPGGFFQYNKNPNSQIYAIKRLSLEDHKIETITGGPGGALRPQISPDGNWLAFVKRVRTKSVLYIRNLATGSERPVYDELSKDQQEAWAIFGPYSNYNWLPDNQNIIIWAKGKIKKVNITNYQVIEIPFAAKAKHKIINSVEFKNEVDPDQFTAKAIRHAVTSPDGKTLIFNAAGYLYRKSLPGGTPARLTKGTDLEFEPAFSRDGRKLTFVTWSDVEMGAINVLDLTNSRATPTKITKEKGIYRNPSFSPDASQIVYEKENGNSHQGFVYTEEPGIYLISASGGKPAKVKDNGVNPIFNRSGDRIFFQSGGYLFGNLTKTYRSAKLDGTDEQTLFESKYAHRIIPSPDNEWVAFSQLYKVYVAPFPKTGTTLNLDGKSNPFPVSQIARDAGINIHWSADSKKIHWTLGEEYFSIDINDRFTFLEGSPDSIPPLDTAGIKINLILKSDKPGGQIAIKGATILTMKGDEVISNGVILIEGNKITAIGTEDQVPYPNNAYVIDATGKYVMPGLIDAHAHVGQFRYGLSPNKHWEYYTNLAYGVTTTHDPSANTEMVFSQSEMVKSGVMVGPRIFSTGTILYGAEGDFKAVINNLDDARSAMRRMKAFGAFSVKSYNQPRREQRQQVIKAAREYSIMVYPEGGSTFTTNMTMILDGHTGIEHNIPVAPLYEDVIKLWAASGTGYTPTLIVNYGGLSGEYFFYQTTNVWENEKLLKYFPRGSIDSRSRHRTMVPIEEYENGHILTSQSCKKLTDAGVKVNLGAHGQLQGLG